MKSDELEIKLFGGDEAKRTDREETQAIRGRNDDDDVSVDVCSEI